ncbi:hypothetical protein [Streptomyces spongiae]|uniref:Uncharacterized protein n=1 Tax=Streptomyces spongiae TaxID=565072 RepID=A0A5N8Y0B2_9ACTN|nr:hypothetical protein [Streptomyces spongiae]MPY65037.1 hypothetical protein [Streptomyces spongiae]
MDLLDWYRGRLSSRRLAVLVRHLPRDSATLLEIHGEATHWSVTDHLLACVVDQLAEANWMFATVNRDEDSEPLEYPKPVPRPATTREPEAPPTGAMSDASPSPAPEQPVRNPSPAELAHFFA